MRVPFVDLRGPLAVTVHYIYERFERKTLFDAEFICFHIWAPSMYSTIKIYIIFSKKKIRTSPPENVALEPSWPPSVYERLSVGLRESSIDTEMIIRRL